LQKFKSHLYPTTIALTLHEGRYTVLITSRSILLTMTNVSDNVVQKIKHTFYFQ